MKLCSYMKTLCHLRYMQFGMVESFIANLFIYISLSMNKNITSDVLTAMSVKIYVFLDVTHVLCQNYVTNFLRTCCLHLQGRRIFSALKQHIPEITSTNFYRPKRRHIPEDSHLYKYTCHIQILITMLCQNASHHFLIH